MHNYINNNVYHHDHVYSTVNVSMWYSACCDPRQRGAV